MTLLHIRLPDELAEVISGCIEGANDTDKVRNYLCSGVVGQQLLQYERKKCLARIRYIDEVLKSNIFFGMDRFSKQEKDFFKGTLKIMEERPEYKGNSLFIRSRRALFNETFKRSITTQEFELMLYRFKEEQDGQDQGVQTATKVLLS